MDDLSKYLDNIRFIRWVFEPSPELDLFWQQYETDHPGEINNITLARRIMLKYRTTSKTLTAEEKILMFSRVLKQIEKKKKATISQISYIAALKYAAVALIFLIVGALLFYKPNKTISPVYSFDFEKQLNISQSQLIRSNGDNIILKDKRAILTYKKTGELVINNDTLKSTDELKYENTNSIKKQSFNQLIIPYGKTSEILLSDGTKVILNAGSSLVFPELFTGESREVFLYGEAFFDVKHDSDHPFVVNVNNLRITDLGTSFNISAYPSDGRIETLLTEGKLSIRNNNEGLFDKATELIPGQLASYNTQTNQTSIEEVDIENYILWTQGIMKFESVDLNSIVRKLERFYNIRFQCNDSQLGDLVISGKLELTEDVNEVVVRIAHAASVNIIKKGDGYYEILK